MVELRTISIGGLGRVVTGKTPPSSQPELFGEVHPFLTPTDIDGFARYIEPARFLSPQGRDFQHRLMLPERAVCVVCIGATIGKVCMTSRPSFTNQQVNSIVVNEDDHDPFFVYHLLTTLRDELKSKAGGAATPIINKTAFSEIEVSVPVLPVQQRIAGILSAYDELIENSQKRIKILEAMASSIYREWFVYFRFPGHESVPLVPSSFGQIPKNWDVVKLGTQLAALESGKRPKGGIREVDGGVPSIGAENINGIGRHNFGAEKFIPREFFNEMRSGVVENRDVAIYKDGAYIGKSSYFRDGFPHVESSVNEHVFLLRCTGERLKQNALYLWLQEPDTVQLIRSKNANAAQPGINQQTVRGLDLIVPDSIIAEQFDKLVDPLLAEIIVIATKIYNLRRTRDLLLPRLLSGQIDVDTIDV
jgi:type I restriction enzyme S subunit